MREVPLYGSNERVLTSSRFFAAMHQNPEMNILKILSVEEFREFRALVIRLLLQTDMSSHFSALKDFKALQARPVPSRVRV